MKRLFLTLSSAAMLTAAIGTTASAQSSNWQTQPSDIAESTSVQEIQIASYQSSEQLGILGRIVESGERSTLGMTFSEKERYENEQASRQLLASFGDSLLENATYEPWPDFHFAGLGGYVQKDNLSFAGIELTDTKAGLIILPLAVEFDGRNNGIDDGWTLGIGATTRTDKPFFGLF